MHFLYSTDIIQTGTKVRNGQNESYIKVKKALETCCPNELCNKSVIISLSVKDSSTFHDVTVEL